ncbi:MAG: N-acetyltransferase family protein [Thermoplasmata archaeon]|nr:N-acetyltransferase family protein [Thermoplasmata archaeon]
MTRKDSPNAPRRLPTIRTARVGDADRIRTIYNEAVQSTTATFDTEPRSLAEQVSWLKDHDGRHPVLVAELGPTLVGWAALSPWSERQAYNGTAEISVYVDPAWRNRGVGRALLTELLAEGSRCGLHLVLARIAEGNPVSRALHVVMGFSSVGVMHEVGNKFGRYLDVELLELRLAAAPAHR